MGKRLTQARWDAVWGAILEGLTEMNVPYQQEWDFDDPNHPSKEIRFAWQGAVILLKRYSK